MSEKVIERNKEILARRYTFGAASAGPQDLKRSRYFSLASDASDFVTGHTLIVDGGQSRLIRARRHYEHFRSPPLRFPSLRGAAIFRAELRWSAIRRTLPTGNSLTAPAVLAGALHQAGVQPGDRVAFSEFPIATALLEALLRSARSRCRAAPRFNIRLAAGELSYILNDSGANNPLVEKQFLGLGPSLFRKDIP